MFEIIAPFGAKKKKKALAYEELRYIKLKDF